MENKEDLKKQAYTLGAASLVEGVSTAPEILAMWLQLADTQEDYTIQACLLYAVCQAACSTEDAEATEDAKATAKAAEIVADMIIKAAQQSITKDPKRTQEYLQRLHRNVCLVKHLSEKKALTREDSRYITNEWTDKEILDRLNTDRLKEFLPTWKTDKYAGFFELPEPYRTAAQNGNYGAYIEDLVQSKAAAPAAEPQQGSKCNGKRTKRL